MSRQLPGAGGGGVGSGTRSKHRADHKCGTCKGNVKNKDKAMQCNICEMWHHVECEDVSDGVYEFLVNNELETIHWYCKKCNGISGNILSHLTALFKRQDEVEARMIALEEESKSKHEEVMKEINEVKSQVFIEREVDSKYEEVMREINEVKTKMLIEGEAENKYEEVMKELKEVKAKVVSENQKDKDSYRNVLLTEVKQTPEQASVNQVTESVPVRKPANRVQEGTERKNNLIIHGAQEQVNKDLNLGLRAEKTKQDTRIFHEICNEIGVESYEDDVIEVKRVGQYHQTVNIANQNPKPKGRPIMVTLKEGVKDSVMRSAYKIRDAESEMIRALRVSHDMSKEERVRDKELKEEAKAKNEKQGEIEAGNFYVVRGEPWNRHLVKVRRRGTGDRGEGVQTMSGTGGAMSKAKNPTEDRTVEEIIEKGTEEGKKATTVTLVVSPLKGEIEKPGSQAREISTQA